MYSLEDRHHWSLSLCVILALTLSLVGCGGSADPDPPPGSSGGPGGGGPGDGGGGTGGTGGGGSSAAEYLYIAAQFDSQRVHGFKIDTTTGALAAVPASPWTPPEWIEEMVADLSSPHVFAAIDSDPAGSFGSGIVAYTMGSDGTLTAAEPVKTGQHAGVSPDGKFLYVLESDLITYRINANGSISEVDRDVLPDAGPGGFDIELNPTGTFVYLTADLNLGGGTVLSYRRDSATGALSGPVGRADHPGNLDHMTFTADGQFMYATAATETGNWIAGFRAGADGSVAMLEPFTTTVPVESPFARAHPVDARLLVVAGRDGAVVYRVDAAGSFSQLGSTPLELGFSRAAFTTSGAFVYFPRFDAVQAFAINTTTGALTPVAGSPFAAPGALSGPAVKRR